MSVQDDLRTILDQALGLGPRAAQITEDSALLGEIPEFDSMAVVTILTSIEEHFGVVVDDDEVSAETFETFGSLAAFVLAKVEG